MVATHLTECGLPYKAVNLREKGVIQPGLIKVEAKHLPRGWSNGHRKPENERRLTLIDI